MSEELLSNEDYERILAQLPPEDAQKLRDQRELLLKHARHTAYVAIVTQNLSHGIGIHVFE